MHYIVVIGDVVGSRFIHDREQFQVTFTKAIDWVNTRQAPRVPYAVTLGDEIEAVYQDGRHMFRDMWHIAAALYPHRIRFAIAVGGITTGIDLPNVAAMDGPAFHHARARIIRLKQDKSLLGVAGEPDFDVALEDRACQVLSYLTSSWKQTRWKVLRELLLGQSAKEIGQELGITTRAAYKNVEAGALAAIIGLGDEISASLTKKAGQE